MNIRSISILTLASIALGGLAGCSGEDDGVAMHPPDPAKQAEKVKNDPRLSQAEKDAILGAMGGQRGNSNGPAAASR
jgi:hypothetical protein